MRTILNFVLNNDSLLILNNDLQLILVNFRELANVYYFVLVPHGNCHKGGGVAICSTYVPTAHNLNIFSLTSTRVLKKPPSMEGLLSLPLFGASVGFVFDLDRQIRRLDVNDFSRFTDNTSNGIKNLACRL